MEVEDVTPESSPEEEKPKKSESPAEALSTDTPDDKGTYVPRTRLNAAKEEARKAKEELQSLQSRLEALESKSNQPQHEDDSVREATKLIEDVSGPLARKEAIKAFENAFGMSISEAKAKLETSDRVEREQTWMKLCAKEGVDPANKEVQAVFSGLARLDLTHEDAIKRTKQLLGKKAAIEDHGANVETAGIGGVPTSSDWLPKDNADAVKGALAGKRARHLSTSEVLARRGK